MSGSAEAAGQLCRACTQVYGSNGKTDSLDHLDSVLVQDARMVDCKAAGDLHSHDLANTVLVHWLHEVAQALAFLEHLLVPAGL